MTNKEIEKIGMKSVLRHIEELEDDALSPYIRATFEPILQNIYLESRALELAAEAIGALSRHSSAPQIAASMMKPANR